MLELGIKNSKKELEDFDKNEEKQKSLKREQKKITMTFLIIIMTF